MAPSLQLHYLSNLLSLPTAVYAAILLFLIKEGLEWNRRKRADKRKLSVFRRMLAYECERNNWFIKSLQSDAKKVRPERKAYLIKTDGSGRQRFVFLGRDGTEGISGIFPLVHRTTFEKLAIEVGYVDPKLADKVSKALDAALELEHIRNSIIDYAPGSEEYQYDEFYQAFWNYVRRRLKGNHDDLSLLYLACTGRGLKEFRLV
ncbi:hypothetical protein HJB96_09050 [Rhizobium sp. NLR15a]|uniref:hypothetical protein n=1 Tax=Rhizobium sp. NLR15a TaxID=2731111 RepID=UPI001C835EBF|nr:hypothetical protein [Rhizobium sp. NLR15a]MBX5293089.1 hypothetical protein [Rhizobium sp. NLR15a]